MIRFDAIHESLLAHHGPQGWWPAADQFEIMVGALLVQRTNWPNVETAIDRLGQGGLLRPRALYRAPVRHVEASISGVGFYRAKARRLKGLARFVERMGGIRGLEQEATGTLRRRLLDLEGIGAETADAILLYAFNRPVVVIDEYLRRLVVRMMAVDRVRDGELRASVERDLANDVHRLNELHALVVAHGKASCRKIPRCVDCTFRGSCRTGAAASDA
ncbi:MAG: endonuclease [Gammaproteobacteria bacterium]